MPFTNRPLILENLEARTLFSSSLGAGIFVSVEPAQSNEAATAFASQGVVQSPAFHRGGFGLPDREGVLLPPGLALDEQALHDALSALAAQFAAITTSTIQASSVVSLSTPASQTSATAAPVAAAAAPSAQTAPIASETASVPDASARQASVDAKVLTEQIKATSVATLFAEPSITTAGLGELSTKSAGMPVHQVVSAIPETSLQLIAPTTVSLWPVVIQDIRVFSTIPLAADPATASERSSQIETGTISHTVSPEHSAIDNLFAAPHVVPDSIAVASSAGLAATFAPRGQHDGPEMSNGPQIAAVVTAAGAMLLGRWRLARSRNGRAATPFSSFHRIGGKQEIE